MVHLRNPEYSFRYAGGSDPAMLRRPDVWDLDMYVFDNLTQLIGNRKYRDPAAACERFAEGIESGFEPEIHLTVRDEKLDDRKLSVQRIYGMRACE